MEHVAELLDLSPAYVRGVATFYTMFYKEPMGKCHVQVCTNLSCTLRGAEKIVRGLEDRLGVKVGQTTGDKLFSLSEVECLGSCGTAPRYPGQRRLSREPDPGEYAQPDR